MKKRKFCTALVMSCMMLVSGFAAACDSESIQVEISTENNVTTLKPGESTKIIMDVENDDIVLDIIDGEEYATLSSNGVLTIKENVLAGEVVTTVAKLDNKVVSNELDITVGAVALTALTISANKNDVVPGSAVTLSYVATPTNANEKIEWKIVDGAEHASIIGNTLIIADTALAGTIIKVKAQAESMSSEELTFTVGQASSEVAFLSLNDKYVVDNGASTLTAINVEVYDGTGTTVADKTIEYSIISGADVLDLNPEGYSCELNVLGHGTAKVRVSIAGTTTYKDVDVNCIKAPEQILAPVALADKAGIEFHSGFGTNNAINNFEFQTTGSNVCQEMTYKFEKLNNTTYETTTNVTLVNDTLTFAEVGTYKITARSNSGSVSEVSHEMVFHVNEGVNVSTYEEFKANAEAGKIVNIFNMAQTGNTGEYDLIPAVILNNTLGNEPTYQEISNAIADMSVRIIHKNTFINGNGYKLDVSGLKYYNVINPTGDGDLYRDYGNLIDIDCNQEYKTAYKGVARQLTQADFIVSINDLEVVGNASVGGNIGDKIYNADSDQTLEKLMTEHLVIDDDSNPAGKLRSSFNRGIEIGGDQEFVAYQVSINNVKVSGFSAGVRISHAVNSKMSNAYVGNCFTNGIEVSASEMCFENMTYGLCGAAGIEITPDNCTKSGLHFNSKQTITFAGDISTTNLNNGSTPYMKIWAATELGGTTVAQIIQGSMLASIYKESYNNDVTPNEDDIKKMSNAKTTNGDIAFVALMFNGKTEKNESILAYANFDANGIIDFGDIQAENDNHTYITLTLGTFGTALLYNINELNK